MTGISYDDLNSRLTTGARTLFFDMTDAHLNASGDRLFIRADTSGATGLIFRGGASRADFRGFDGGALDDLVTYGLLHTGFSARGTQNYRVSGEGLHFHKWLMDQTGTPIDQVQRETARFVDSAQFANRHRGCAHHLRQAFDLIWEGRTDDQVVSEIGDHLRKSLMDIVTDLVGADAAGRQEKPIDRLKDWIQSRPCTEREKTVLAATADLARATLRLDHRLNHIRDQQDKGEPPASWAETKRAAFVTAFACQQLASAGV